MRGRLEQWDDWAAASSRLPYAGAASSPPESIGSGKYPRSKDHWSGGRGQNGSRSHSGITPLVLIGSGGHGRVVADMAEATGDYRIIAVADDKFPVIELKDGICYGPPSMVRKLLRADVEMQAIIAIGDNRMRFMMAERLGIAAERYALIIHPGAHISQHAAISPGTVIMPGAVVNTGARIDTHAIINSGAIIEHDAEIGPYAHISPGAALAGGVRVGEGAHVGIGASVIQSVRLGSWSVLGAGGAAVRDIPGGTTAVGVPARPVVHAGKIKEQETERAEAHMASQNQA